MDEREMATVSGVILAESLRTGAPLEGVALVVEKISRADVGDVSAGQPLTWTFIHFEAPLDDVDRLADELSRALRPDVGWYCDFRSSEETFVVFGGRVFRYPRGNADRRREVEEYARSVGVPEGQLDWPE